MNDDITLGWLRDLEELRSLPARYAQAADDRDHNAVEACFHPDGTVTTADGDLAASAYVQRMRDNPSPFVSGTHLMGLPVIELEPGSDTARVSTPAVVHQIAGEGGNDLVLGMRYVDTVVRTEDGWLIEHRTPVRRWMR